MKKAVDLLMLCEGEQKKTKAGFSGSTCPWTNGNHPGPASLIGVCPNSYRCENCNLFN